MAVLKLAWKSLLNRRLTAVLTIGAIALSVMLLIGVVLLAVLVWISTRRYRPGTAS